MQAEMVLVCWYCLALMQEKTVRTGGDTVGSQYHMRSPTSELAKQTEAEEPVACCCLLFHLDRSGFRCDIGSFMEIA